MKNHIPKKTLRQFGYLICFTFPFLIGWFLPWLGGHSFRVWTLFISMPAGILGILRPGLLLYPYRAWMKLGHILGWLNSRIILGLVFLILGIFFYREFKSFLTAVIFFVTAIVFFYRS